MRRQVFARVMPIVAEDVADRVGNLAPRLEPVGMITVSENGALAAGESIEAFRDADGQALHATRKRLGAVDFQQMQVIALNGVMNDAHSEAKARLAKRIFQQPRPPIGPQIADARLHAHRHMHRMPRTDRFSREMRHSRSDQTRMRPRPRPSRSFAAPSPFRQRKRELSSRGTRIADVIVDGKCVVHRTSLNTSGLRSPPSMRCTAPSPVRPSDRACGV